MQGTHLRAVLKDKNISQSELARLLNTSRQNVANWTKRGVPFRFLPKLRKELNIEYCICKTLETE